MIINEKINKNKTIKESVRIWYLRNWELEGRKMKWRSEEEE